MSELATHVNGRGYVDDETRRALDAHDYVVHRRAVEIGGPLVAFTNESILHPEPTVVAPRATQPRPNYAAPASGPRIGLMV